MSEYKYRIDLKKRIDIIQVKSIIKELNKDLSGIGLKLNELNIEMHKEDVMLKEAGMPEFVSINDDSGFNYLMGDLIFLKDGQLDKFFKSLKKKVCEMYPELVNKVYII